MGNCCRLSGNLLDDLVAKTLELKCPQKLNILLKNHRALMYYPNPKLITQIMQFYHSSKNWTQMKEFYDSIGRKMYVLLIYLILILYKNFYLKLHQKIG